MGAWWCVAFLESSGQEILGPPWPSVVVPSYSDNRGTVALYCMPRGRERVGEKMQLENLRKINC